jgi:phage baseplate assembly protein gpV
MSDQIRIGQVSKVDYGKGMIRVLYTDRDSSVTDILPVVNFNGEYKMPAVGDYVLVAHLSNDTSAGFVLGPYWNESNTPPESGKGVYYKEIAGDAHLEYKDGTLNIVAPTVNIVAPTVNINGTPIG